MQTNENTHSKYADERETLIYALTHAAINEIDEDKAALFAQAAIALRDIALQRPTPQKPRRITRDTVASGIALFAIGSGFFILFAGTVALLTP